MKQTNDSCSIFGEYIYRKRLATLGFTSNISELEYWKAEVFCFIDSEIDKLSKEEMDSKSRK